MIWRMEFIETQTFTRLLAGLLTDDEYAGPPKPQNPCDTEMIKQINYISREYIINECSFEEAPEWNNQTHQWDNDNRN